MDVFHMSKDLDIEFENVWLTVRDNKGYKKIVKGVSGAFKSGELTAIMGPSGAGKTSLLNILTGYQKSGIEGIIKCKNGSKTKSGVGQYANQARYILQDDHLLSYFTVEELMHSTALLKTSGLSPTKLDYMIEDILTTLSLHTIKKTECGRLSGGQRKRLSIALELIDDPSILFLDEPTTGLDSSSSNQCIYMLKTLAQTGRTIICTIHQPSASLFNIFSQVYVMAKGKCVYQGSPYNVVPFLGSQGFVCPKYHNPADFLLEVTNDEYGDCVDKLASAVRENDWSKSSITTKEEIVSEKELEIRRNFDRNDSNEQIGFNRTPPSELRRFNILLKKQLTYYYRDWTVAKLKLLVHFLVGIFLGLFFQNCGYDGSKAIQNVSFFMISTVYISYTSLMPAALRFPQELLIIKKEYFNRWYKLRTFYAAFLAADIPLQIFFGVCYTTASYIISSQPLELFRFGMVVLIICLVGIVASGLGLTYGSLVNPINGTFLGAITTALMITVAGFLCLFPHMNRFFYFASNFSYMSFSMEALLQAVYGYNRDDLICPDDEEFCLYKKPDKLLSDFGMNKLDYWMDVFWMAVIMVVFQVMAYISLRRRMKSL